MQQAARASTTRRGDLGHRELVERVSAALAPGFTGYFQPLAAIAGSINAAALLGRCLHWTRQIYPAGRTSFYKSLLAWQHETGLHYRELVNARRQLIDKGYLTIVARRGMPPVCHYQVNLPTVVSALCNQFSIELPPGADQANPATVYKLLGKPRYFSLHLARLTNSFVASLYATDLFLRYRVACTTQRRVVFTVTDANSYLDLSRREQEYARRVLRSMGLVTEVRTCTAPPVKHVGLQLEAILALLGSTSAESSHSPDAEVEDRQNVLPFETSHSQVCNAQNVSIVRNGPISSESGASVSTANTSHSQVRTAQNVAIELSETSQMIETKRAVQSAQNVANDRDVLRSSLYREVETTYTPPPSPPATAQARPPKGVGVDEIDFLDLIVPEHRASLCAEMPSDAAVAQTLVDELIGQVMRPSRGQPIDNRVAYLRRIIINHWNGGGRPLDYADQGKKIRQRTQANRQRLAATTEPPPRRDASDQSPEWKAELDAARGRVMAMVRKPAC